MAGDRIQLQQVVGNLLRNAVEAMGGVEDRPREIVVRTALGEGSRVCLSVRDSGVGFDPREAEQLFDAFYTNKPNGMGMGLSVSRSIVESHGGRLRAAPNDGPGATFAFSLPPAPARRAERHRRPAGPGPADTFVQWMRLRPPARFPCRSGRNRHSSSASREERP